MQIFQSGFDWVNYRHPLQALSGTLHFPGVSPEYLEQQHGGSIYGGLRRCVYLRGERQGPNGSSFCRGKPLGGSCIRNRRYRSQITFASPRNCFLKQGKPLLIARVIIIGPLESLSTFLHEYNLIPTVKSTYLSRLLQWLG